MEISRSSRSLSSSSRLPTPDDHFSFSRDSSQSPEAFELATTAVIHPFPVTNRLSLKIYNASIYRNLNRLKFTLASPPIFTQSSPRMSIACLDDVLSRFPRLVQPSSIALRSYGRSPTEFTPQYSIEAFFVTRSRVVRVRGLILMAPQVANSRRARLAI